MVLRRVVRSVDEGVPLGRCPWRRQLIDRLQKIISKISNALSPTEHIQTHSESVESVEEVSQTRRQHEHETTDRSKTRKTTDLSTSTIADNDELSANFRHMWSLNVKNVWMREAG
jgi:hypothetical protein